jgi:protein phosphatase
VDVARERFGVIGEGIGMCYTRTGRRFFTDPEVEREFLARLHAAIDATNFWEQFKTDWFCLDCELMPWSMKAQELLRRQYAPTAAAARVAFADAVAVMERTAARAPDIEPVLARYRDRAAMIDRYATAYRRYCWPVQSVSDLKLAPFHLLASERTVHIDKDHVWHMDTLAQLCHAADELLLPTPYRVIDVTDPASVEAGTSWWEELTERGGEGMVVKPLPYAVKGLRGLVQPALKCRGREYLRIIYGPEYTAPEHLDRLRHRGLSLKRSLALREFALGIESLERFCRREPLRRVHECVFAILALESEPVDPRL